MTTKLFIFVSSLVQYWLAAKEAELVYKGIVNKIEKTNL